MGQTLGGVGVRFFLGRAGSPSNTKSPGPRPTSIPSGILVHPAVWPAMDIGRKLGGLCPFRGGELGPHLTQCCLGWGLPPYQVVSWYIQPFGHNISGPKIGGSAPFWGRGAGFPSSTMWPVAHLHAKYHLDPSSRLATIDIGRKLEGSAPFLGGGDRSPSYTKSPGTSLGLPLVPGTAAVRHRHCLLVCQAAKTAKLVAPSC